MINFQYKFAKKLLYMTELYDYPACIMHITHIQHFDCITLLLVMLAAPQLLLFDFIYTRLAVLEYYKRTTHCKCENAL